MMNLAAESLAIIKGKLNFFVSFDTGGEVDKAALSSVFKTPAGPEYSKPVETALGQMTGLIVSDKNKICNALTQADVYAMGVGIIRVEFEVPDGMLAQEIINAMH
ncbi:MAG TPA: hypothetical protein VMC61_03515, partial [Methanocella sp.]|nr:hypothetical protein [Methanocella sp.]